MVARAVRLSDDAARRRQASTFLEVFYRVRTATTVDTGNLPTVLDFCFTSIRK